MIDFLKRLFGQSNSSATAKERLRLVLMTDHLELAPEMIDAMKHDLVEVISRFVEVDRERIDVTFERQDRALAMLANIPIISVNRPNGNGTAHEEPAPQPEVPVAVVAPPAETPAVTNGKRPATRKRRSRKKTRPASAPGPTAPVTAM